MKNEKYRSPCWLFLLKEKNAKTTKSRLVRNMGVAKGLKENSRFINSLNSKEKGI
jgi:hypothetical protein